MGQKPKNESSCPSSSTKGKITPSSANDSMSSTKELIEDYSPSAPPSTGTLHKPRKAKLNLEAEELSLLAG